MTWNPCQSQNHTLVTTNLSESQNNSVPTFDATLFSRAQRKVPPRGLLPRRLFVRPDVLRGEPVDLHAVPNTAPVKASGNRAPTDASPAGLTLHRRCIVQARLLGLAGLQLHPASFACWTGLERGPLSQTDVFGFTTSRYYKPLSGNSIGIYFKHSWRHLFADSRQIHCW
jgi:hypothetical protein